MNYSEFIEIVKKHTSLEPKSRLQYKTDSFFRYHREEKKKDEADFFFYNEDSTGGISGGSCWDNGEEDHHQEYTNESGALDAIKGFDSELDAILAEVCPSITFLQYKNVYDEVVKTATRTENEYYGNSTNYLCVYCEVRELYEALVQKGLI